MLQNKKGVVLWIYQKLKRGCVKFDAGVFDPYNETLGIDIKFLPLWLAKISITPTMQRDNPILVEKLVNYQLKAASVLAKAFINPNDRFISRTELDFILNEKIKPFEIEIARLRSDFGKILYLDKCKENENKKPDYSTFVHDTVKPLAEKYADISKGYPITDHLNDLP